MICWRSNRVSWFDNQVVVATYTSFVSRKPLATKLSSFIRKRGSSTGKRVLLTQKLGWFDSKPFFFKIETEVLDSKPSVFTRHFGLSIRNPGLLTWQSGFWPDAAERCCSARRIFTANPLSSILLNHWKSLRFSDFSLILRDTPWFKYIVYTTRVVHYTTLMFMHSESPRYKLPLNDSYPNVLSIATPTSSSHFL